MCRAIYERCASFGWPIERINLLKELQKLLTRPQLIMYTQKCRCVVLTVMSSVLFVRSRSANENAWRPNAKTHDRLRVVKDVKENI